MIYFIGGVAQAGKTGGWQNIVFSHYVRHECASLTLPYFDVSEHFMDTREQAYRSLRGM